MIRVGNRADIFDHTQIHVDVILYIFASGKKPWELKRSGRPRRWRWKISLPLRCSSSVDKLSI